MIDKDFEFGVYILNKESARTHELQQEQLGLQTELGKVENEIQLRSMACRRSELWVAKLTNQVRMMDVGSEMGTTPLSIQNPRVPPGE